MIKSSCSQCSRQRDRELRFTINRWLYDITCINAGEGCWRLIVLMTYKKDLGDEFDQLVTNTHYLCTLASSTNIQKWSPT